MSESGRYESWKAWAPEDFGRFDDADAAAFSAELERAGLTSGPWKLLELGFGNGTFAGWAREQGHDYAGTEASELLVERARAAGFKVALASEPLAALADEGTLDAVVAFDVLEHLAIDDLRHLLADVRTRLKPGGVLLARVPSGDSPFGRAILHGDLTHRTALGSSAVRQLANESGFELLHASPPALPIRGLGLRRGLRRLALRETQRLVGRAISLAFHDGQRTVITANMVFVLRKTG